MRLLVSGRYQHTLLGPLGPTFEQEVKVETEGPMNCHFIIQSPTKYDNPCPKAIISNYWPHFLSNLDKNYLF